MDFKQLTYIVKVAELGNVTKAARELYVSQPSLSSFIAKVEDELGQEIFNRSTNPLTLTYVGELYVSAAREMLSRYSNMQIEINEAVEGKRGRLVIGIPPARASHMLPHVLAEYSARYPEVRIETIEHNTRQLKEDLDRGIVDFAIVPLMDDAIEGYECLTIYEEELFLVAEKDRLDESYYDLADDKKIIRLEKLQEEPFILLKKGHGIRNALDTIFDHYGYKPKIYMETTNNETAYRLASAGLGLAIVPEMNIKTLRRIHRMDVFRLSRKGMKWKVTAVWPKGTYLPRLQRDFLSLMQATFPEKVEEISGWYAQ